MDTEILLQILNDTYELIKEESHWTQETFARNATGQSVAVEDPTACKWCVTGALHAVVCRAYKARAWSVEDYYNWDVASYCVLARTMGEYLHSFNDSHSHAEVLSAIQATIANIKTA